MCYAGNYIIIAEIIIIVMVITYIEKPVTFQTEWLMNLKIKTDGLHILWYFFIFYSY